MVFKSNRWFWAGLALIVVLAAIPRLLSYGFSLPYIDHPDEPNKYLEALAWRGLFERHEEGYYRGYPPGYLIVSYIVQVIGAPLGLQGAGETIRVMRLLSVLVNLGTLVFIALTARLAGGNLAGWVAGAAWGVSPLVLEHGVYAIQDPFVYFWVSAALWLASVAILDEKRKHWAIWSVMAGLTAIIFKYSVVAAVIPGGLVALVYFARDRRNWRDLAIQAALVIPVGVWMIPQIQAMQTWQRHAADAMEGTLQHLFMPERVLNNLYHAILPLDGVAFLIVAAIGVAAFIHARRHDRPGVRWEVVALALIITITIPWTASVFSEITPNRIKDALPATAAACAILGAAVMQIIHTVPRHWSSVASAAIPALLVLGVFVPQALEDGRLVHDRMLPDRRVAMRLWADVNLEPGTVLVTYENEKTFNPFWGGIQGRKWFDWQRDDHFPPPTVEQLRDERGVSYAVVPLWLWQEMQQTEEGQAFLSQVLPLRAFIGPPEQRGPEMIVCRLWRMQTETQVRFGEAIMLIGYDLDTKQVAPGQPVTFRFYWNARSRPPENYSLFVHLMPVDRVELITQADGNPAAPERLTQTWDDPGETIISPLFTLTIPADLAPGEYRAVMGLYNYETGVRLPVTDMITGRFLGNMFEVARITVIE